VKQNHF